MTEETTTSTNTGATETKQTDTFVPAWKIKSDELKAKASDDEKVVYRSDQYNDCLPVLMPKSSVITYPFIAEEPKGFIAPKYNYNVIGSGWVETASLAQAKEIKLLKKQVADIQENNESVAQDNKEITEKINNISEKSENYEKSNSQQLGQILTMVSALLAKSTSTTTPTEPETKPTGSTTTAETNN